MSGGINRRHFLAGAAGAGGLAAVLAACGGSSATTGSETTGGSSEASAASRSASATAGAGSTAASSASSSAGGSANGVLPTHIKFAGVKPDMAAPNANSVETFFTYPDPPINAVPEKPLSGGKVTVIAAQSSYQPLPMSKNKWWQNINEEIGATFDLTMIPGADYPARFSSMVAGDNLPEVVRIPVVPNLDQVLDAKFADLTEHLSGDAVKDYPMLANFGDLTWKGAVYGNKIYGVPMPLILLSSVLEGRTDIMEPLGVSPTPADSDEFLAMCRALTDDKKQRWAMAQPATAVYIKQMCGVPNVWAVADGKFTNEVETDEYKQWLSFVTKMWNEGLFHPNSFSNPQLVTLFEGGHFVLFEIGGGGLDVAVRTYQAADPNFKATAMAPPKFDGGGLAPVYLSSGNNGITAINKKASAARVKELLAMLNFLAAPFGTTQYLDTQFGAKGPDYTWQSGQGPVATTLANNERIVANYIPGAPFVNYAPGFTEYAKDEYAYQSKVGSTALPLPTVGLYSPTDSTKGATLTKMINDAVADVIQGRKTVSGWDSIVKQWRSGGGDTIRGEYEKQYAQTNS
jgi:putative aldouronate transport system substrate-binding protein